MPDKKTPTKKAVSKKAAKKASKKVAAKTASAATKKAVAKKSSKKTVSKPASAGFSLDDALAVAKKRTTESTTTAAKKAAKEKAKRDLEAAEQKAEKRVLGAASLADILGIGGEAPKKINHRERKIPKKYETFHRLLMELHDHVSTGLHQHAEDTLKRSSKEDAGDLSGYSQHMADAGTDTFDRDFALSMVSSEQDALHEIEEALERIYSGTYGICQMTGKQIRDERLMAVPFTRYSMKTQTEMERNKPKANRVGGVFTDASAEDGIGFTNEDSDDD